MTEIKTTTLERTPQTPKKFDGRKQDHGDAAQQRGHDKPNFWEKKFDDRGIMNAEKSRLLDALSNTDKHHELMGRAEREALADSMLEFFGPSDELSEYTVLSSKYKPDVPVRIFVDDESDDSEEIPVHHLDNFPTEAEFGVKSKKAVRDAMADRATLGYDPDSDPGDDDFSSPIHITNRL